MVSKRNPGGSFNNCHLSQDQWPETLFKEAMKEAVKEAIIELMATDEGRAAFGPLMYDAVGQWIKSYDLEMEHTRKDGRVEIVKQKGDILAYIAAWIKNSEGAIRGCQSDAAGARNRSIDTGKLVAAVVEQGRRRGLLLPMDPLPDPPVAIGRVAGSEPES